MSDTCRVWCRTTGLIRLPHRTFNPYVACAGEWVLAMGKSYITCNNGLSPKPRRAHRFATRADAEAFRRASRPSAQVWQVVDGGAYRATGTDP